MVKSIVFGVGVDFLIYNVIDEEIWVIFFILFKIIRYFGLIFDLLL